MLLCFHTGCTHFIEIGPSLTLAKMARFCLPSTPGKTFSLQYDCMNVWLALVVRCVSKSDFMRITCNAVANLPSCNCYCWLTLCNWTKHWCLYNCISANAGDQPKHWYASIQRDRQASFQTVAAGESPCIRHMSSHLCQVCSSETITPRQCSTPDKLFA